MIVDLPHRPSASSASSERLSNLRDALAASCTAVAVIAAGAAVALSLLPWY